MMKHIHFTVLGEPFGKQRPRFKKIGNFTKTYTPEKTISYENYIKVLFQDEAKGDKFSDDAMLDVRIIAYYGIPKSVSKKKREMMLEHKIRPTKKPDFDNIGKVVCDSLNGIAYRDDAMVVDAQVRKFFSEKPRVEVYIKDINGGN